MAVPTSMNGARALVKLAVPGQPIVSIGLFVEISYNLTYTAAPLDTLGRYGAAEIDYTGVELVDISATGWRVIGHGPHASMGIPKWQDLLLHDYIQFVILDRATTDVICTIEKVRPLGYSTSIAAKSLTQIPVRYVGILVSDESGSNFINEDGSASTLLG